jgi:general secretion pathway protein K
LRSSLNRAPASDHERGIALGLVLWILALISVLVITFTGEARTELRIARNQYETARARALADAGVSFAIMALLDPSPEARWRAAGEEHEITYADGSIRVSAQDEAGKISLNDAPDEMFAGLFRTLGESAAESAGLGAAIVQWRESRRSEWASAGAFGAAGAGNARAPEPFLAIEELRLVPGVTRAFYERVSPYLSVYADSAQVDPLTAPVEVLRSLPGVSAQQVDAYIADRAQPVAVGSAVLPPVRGLSPFLANPVERTVTITSEGRTASGTQFVREAVAATTGERDEPYRLLAWRRARSQQDVRQGSE